MTPSVPSTSELPSQGRLLGIDYGIRRVGVAVCDEFQRLASPLHNYERVSQAADEAFFRELTREYQITGIIVGLPLHMNGDESQMSLESTRYGIWLRSITNLPVAYQDERLTTSHAEALLQEAGVTIKKRKARIDKLAAQILLQSWLDR